MANERDIMSAPLIGRGWPHPGTSFGTRWQEIATTG